MKIRSLAGMPADPGILVNVLRLVTAYYTEVSGTSVPALTSALEVLAANGVEVMITRSVARLLSRGTHEEN